MQLYDHNTFMSVASKIKNYLKKNFVWVQTSNWSFVKLSTLFKNDAILDMNTFYELYRFNGDIRQSVRKLAQAISRNWIYLKDNNKKTIDNEQLTEEVFDLFKAPTFLKFKVDLYRNYMISWELYILPLYNVEWTCIWFDILDSRAVNKTVDEYWNILKFTVFSQWRTATYQPDQIAYFKFEDDTNNQADWMWLLHWIVYDALSDLEAMRTNYYFYQNSAVPSAMILLDDWLDEDEQQNAKDMFDAQFRWSKNQHKTIVSWWVKDIKTISLTPRDMEFINQRHLTTDKISACFQVPKFLLGYGENANYNNWSNFRKEFIEWTVRPLEQDFENILNRLLAMFRKDLYEKVRIICDWEQLDESQERMEWLRKDVASWIMTINEARIERWFEKLNDENADKPVISRNLVLLEDVWLDAVLPLNE